MYFRLIAGIAAEYINRHDPAEGNSDRNPSDAMNCCLLTECDEYRFGELVAIRKFGLAPIAHNPEKRAAL